MHENLFFLVPNYLALSIAPRICAFTYLPKNTKMSVFMSNKLIFLKDEGFLNQRI